LKDSFKSYNNDSLLCTSCYYWKWTKISRRREL